MSTVNDFVSWLTGEIDSRGWNGSELARRASLVPSTVTTVISGTKHPGLEFCVGVSRALGLPPDEVMRRAGLLPSLPPETAEGRRVLELVNRQAPAVRKVLLSMLLGLSGQRATPDPILAELVEIYESLSPEWRGEFMEAARTFALNARAGKPRVIGEEEDDDPPVTE